MEHARLKRMGASTPITDVVLSWKDVSEAIVYFQDQALDDISVLHHNEVESCIELMKKLGLSRAELASQINPYLSKVLLSK